MTGLVRPDATGSNRVTWAEFIEGWLGPAVPPEPPSADDQTADFIESLRDRLGVPYPLADQRPYVAERKLVVEAKKSPIEELTSLSSHQ